MTEHLTADGVGVEVCVYRTTSIALATNAKLRGRMLTILRDVTADAAGGLLSDAACAELLAETDGDLKTATMMALTGADVDTARRRLADHDGHVRAAARSLPG